MLKKFLEDVISNVAGKQAEGISDLLDNKKHVNEFLIAKKLDLTINQTRNILYKISDYGLVSSIRKKDKKKGWYTYFWKIETVKALEFLQTLFIKQMDQINSQINSRETKEFYVCERCNIEFNQENALLYDFACRECGDIFSLKDNTKLVRELKKNYSKLGNELKAVQEELEKEKGKVEKQREGELKKKEKEKKDDRAKKRAKQAKLKKVEFIAKKNKPKKKAADKTKITKRKTKALRNVIKSVKKSVKKKQTKRKAKANLKTPRSALKKKLFKRKVKKSSEKKK